MSDFQVGDRVEFRRKGTKSCAGVYVGTIDNEFGRLAYIRPDADQHHWGTPLRNAFGEEGLYCFYEKEVYLAEPPLTPQEKVLMKVASLTRRFKAKTLPKTKQKVLPLP